jgi:hypothetical protein
MDVSDMKKKLGKGSVQRKKAEKDADDLRKLMFLAYNVYAAVLNACESERAGVKPRARMAKHLPPHLDRAIIQAESFEQRDMLCRRLSSQCYRWAKWFMQKADYKQALKWMNLSLRYLRLSMDPKKESQAEKLETQLAELERKLDKLKEEEAEGR